jgi:hypothetical protein
MLVRSDRERSFVSEHCSVPLRGGPLRGVGKDEASEREGSRLGRRLGDISSGANHEEVPCPTSPR